MGNLKGERVSGEENTPSVDGGADLVDGGADLQVGPGDHVRPETY
jgi:hypothetical protein